DGRGRRVVAPAQPTCPSCPPVLRWSPNGERLALSDARGLRVYATATRRLRTLDRGPTGDIAWAPSGTLLAYEATTAHALRLASLTGTMRTLHTFTANATISSLQWSQPPVGTAAKPPEPVPWIQQPAPGAIKLRTPLVELAANGDTIAYLTCGNVVGRWRPSTGTLEELLPEWATPPYTVAACCNPAWSSTATSGVALYDSALAYWRSAGGNSKAWWLSTTDRSPTAPITGWRTTTGNPPLGGWTLGGGDVLVFSARRIESAYPSPPRVVEQTIWRVREPGHAGACPTEGELKPGPCQLLATEPGPFVPHDVDAGRIVAAGDNAVVLLDGTGTRLLTVPVKATASALAGDDLVVLVPGQLRHYSATTGSLLHTWALPDVASGAPCGFGLQTYLCPDVRLRFWDTARGLAAYTLDGQIHLVRLADGTDIVLAAGIAARFVTSGLVYATTATDATYPYRLTFVPTERLPRT
ncbi:MAG: hypothetical protein ACRC50_07150, partial [Gaiella sp.]